MTLRSYLRIFRERFVVFIFVFLLCVAVAVVITVLTPKKYSAQAQVYVRSNTSSQSPTELNNGQAAVLSQVQTMAQLIHNPEILDQTAALLRSRSQIALTPDELRSSLSASAPDQQALVLIDGTDRDPQVAAGIANAAATAFASTVEALNRPSGSATSSIRLDVTLPAETPSDPVAPDTAINITLGVIIGLLLGAVVAIVRDLLDNRIKQVDTLVRLTGAPAMGVIADDRAVRRVPVASRSGGSTAQAESFRQLRANLQFADIDRHPRVIAVTSSVPGEGKSVVALNLAATLAQAGVSVCLVDADLRRPAIAKTLGLPGAVGLTTALIQQVSVADALQDAGDNLQVLTSGPVPPNPSELLASVSMRDTIAGLLEQFHYVVIDSAPLLPVADGAEVAGLAEGVLLVAQNNSTTEAQVRRSVATLDRVGARLLGVVLNRVSGKGGAYIGYYQRGQLTPIDSLDAAASVVGRTPPSPTSRHQFEETP